MIYILTDELSGRPNQATVSTMIIFPWALTTYHAESGLSMVGGHLVIAWPDLNSQIKLLHLIWSLAGKVGRLQSRGRFVASDRRLGLPLQQRAPRPHLRALRHTTAGQFRFPHHQGRISTSCDNSAVPSEGRSRVVLIARDLTLLSSQTRIAEPQRDPRTSPKDPTTDLSPANISQSQRWENMWLQAYHIFILAGISQCDIIAYLGRHITKYLGRHITRPTWRRSKALECTATRSTSRCWSKNIRSDHQVIRSSGQTH